MPFCFKTSSSWASWCLALALLLGHKKNIFSEIYFWLVSRVGREQSCIQVSRGVGRHKRVSSLPPPNHLTSEINQMRWNVWRNGTKLYPQRVNFMYTSSSQLYANICHTLPKWIKWSKTGLIHRKRFVFTHIAHINLGYKDMEDREITQKGCKIHAASA